MELSAVSDQLSAAGEQAVRFVEVSRQAGIDFRHRNFATPDKYLVETMGSGCAFLDYDNDGWLDAYFVNGAPLRDEGGGPSNRLYRNRGDGRFEDVTARAGVGDRGYGMGVAVGDIDGDGWADLYVTNFGANVLYRNRGDGRFEDVTARAGVGDARWGASAGFFDYDRDGDVDLYVVNYLQYSLAGNIECRDYDLKERSYCHPHHFPGAADILYRNNGDGTFSDASREAGIDNPEGKGLGVVLSDLDLDGWTDVYVANDSVGNFLYLNRGDGSFRDASLASGSAYNGDGKAEAGMGVDAADLSGDGLPELFVTNLDYETNTLYVNRRDWFEDLTAQSGLGQPGFLQVGFGTRFLDFDNDGDLDLFVANGHILDNVSSSRPWLSYPQPNQLYRNRGVAFEEVAGLPALQVRSVSRGVALGDYDNDGDLDLLVSNCNERAQLLRNEGGNRSNWLRVRFEGSAPHRNGAGVRVRARIDDEIRFFELSGGGSYLSASEAVIHIGLGAAPEIDSLEIIWPGGTVQVIGNVKANQLLPVREAGN